MNTVHGEPLSPLPSTPTDTTVATKCLKHCTTTVSTTTTTRNSPSPSLLLFFILLSLNCLFSSFSSTPSFDTHSISQTQYSNPFSLLQPCHAIPRDNDNNQRVDAPSPDDFPPLEGSNFAFTSQTPLGNLSDPREYADGALATQKLIADALIPLDRQLWTGIDTRTAYFKTDFSAEKIGKVTQLLQAGMRRLVLDIWWDSAALGWQLCPRLKRDTGQQGGLRIALEQEQNRMYASASGGGSSTGGDDALLQLQGMGNIAPVATEATAEELKQEFRQGEEQDQAQKDASSTETMSTASTTSTATTERSTEEQEGPDNSHPAVHKRASPKKITENSSTVVASGDHSHTLSGSNIVNKIKQAAATVGLKDKNRSSSRGREWYHKKKRPVRPPIKPKASALDPNSNNHRHKQPMASEATPNRESSRYAASHGRAPHRLAINKGVVASYSAAQAVDQTADGITCSSGEDLTMLLQALLSWIGLTSDVELGDVILIILNLNELGTNSLGSRPTPPTPVTPAPVPGATPPVTSPPISNAEFFGQIISPNTNRTVNEAATNIVSLKKLFTDAFPSLIYSPNILEQERANLGETWWKDGAVGLDYYNTTRNPTTNRIQAPTGWPTSAYLKYAINRRIVVGIGANNLAANTTYNITDDYTTFHPPGVMGPSMTNSSLLRVSSTLNQDACSLPVPGILMYPTGSEENFTQLANLRRNSGTPITSDVTWSFASMSDNDMSPWAYLSGRLATSCGFSSLVEGRSQSLSFSEQTAMSIWSWDLNQPPEEMMRDLNHRCGAMKSSGRWVVQDCNDKLPAACRKIGTSSQWLIYEKGSGNYRDVTCPEGYKFDVPRTGRENQILFAALQAYWNTTAPTFFQSLSAPEPGATASSLKTVLSRLTDTVRSAIKHHKRRDVKAGRVQPRHIKEENDDDDDDDDDEDKRDFKNSGRKGQSLSNERQHSGNSTGTGVQEAKAEKPSHTPSITADAAAAADALSGGGVIWIDISSWQTAGCWVPGGVEGRCPYRDPDNTVALHEIIKVSTIGGVIILVLVGVFLYMKLRRNVRLRKASKRRADVRTKILLTEVETVPA